MIGRVTPWPELPPRALRRLRPHRRGTPAVLLLAALLALAFLIAGCGVPTAHGLTNFGIVEPGVYRGGQPTEEGWTWLAQQGVRVRVKLDYEREGSDAGARARGIKVVDCGMPPSDARDLLTEPTPEQLACAVLALRAAAGVPVFAGCLLGRDRTSVVFALHRVIDDGWARTRAEAEMAAYGFREWRTPELADAWEHFWKRGGKLPGVTP